MLVLLVAGVFAATAMTQLATATPGVLGRVLLLTGSLLLNLALLTVGSQVLTAVSQPWRQLLPGAACGAVGWSVLQGLGVYIVNRQLQQANLVYGVFAVVIVLLGWLYLTAQLLLYAAEINVVLARHLWPRSLLQPPLTAPGQAGADRPGRDRGAPRRAAHRGPVHEADGRQDPPAPPASGAP